MGGFETQKIAMLYNTEALWISQVNKAAYTILVSIIQFDADVELVRPQVVDTDGMYCVFILQYVINEKPKGLMHRCDNGQ